MTITELIERLEAIKAEHGDLVVFSEWMNEETHQYEVLTVEEVEIQRDESGWAYALI